MVNLSDYIIDFLTHKKIKNIFLVSGGGIMFLCDSVSRNKKIDYISNHHEQASCIGAESYARITNNVGACLVTTGPGGTNALTGVASAWVDSVPIIVISGQVRTDIMANYSTQRQTAPQEINIVDLARPVTKYAKTILKSDSIRYELEKAYHLATTGRPGPVWLDIPLNIQNSAVDTEKMKSFSPNLKSLNKNLVKSIKKTINLIKNAKRPVLILGYGVRLSHGDKLVDDLVGKLKMPVLLPYNGMDLLEEKNPYLAGKFGPLGQRRGNFTLQNSDLILSIGASLSLTSIGFNYKGFAPKAKKIMVNIDEGELYKKFLNPDLRVHADAKEFITNLLQELKYNHLPLPQNEKWLMAVRNWKKYYPNIIPEFYKEKRYVNSYVFYDALSDILSNDDIILSGNSLDSVGLYQAFKVKKGQRAFTNTNFGGMGWDLPAAIGASVGNNKKRTILVTGDGSIQFNIQELETVSCYKLPIKIFIINNDGYESIRTTQTNYFEKRFVGADKNSGVTNPNFEYLAKAHNIRYAKILNNNDLHKKIKKVLEKKGPVICELHVHPKQPRIPKTSSYKREDGTIVSPPLEDMYPFLSREEIKENMNLSKD